MSNSEPVEPTYGFTVRVTDDIGRVILHQVSATTPEQAKLLTEEWYRRHHGDQAADDAFYSIE